MFRVKVKPRASCLSQKPMMYSAKEMQQKDDFSPLWEQSDVCFCSEWEPVMELMASGLSPQMVWAFCKAVWQRLLCHWSRPSTLCLLGFEWEWINQMAWERSANLMHFVSRSAAISDPVLNPGTKAVPVRSLTKCISCLNPHLCVGFRQLLETFCYMLIFPGYILGILFIYFERMCF